MQQCKPISIVVEGRNGVDWVVVAVENIKAIPFTNTCAEKDHVSGMAMAWNTHDICMSHHITKLQKHIYGSHTAPLVQTNHSLHSKKKDTILE